MKIFPRVLQGHLHPLPERFKVKGTLVDFASLGFTTKIKDWNYKPESKAKEYIAYTLFFAITLWFWYIVLN